MRFEEIPPERWNRLYKKLERDCTYLMRIWEFIGKHKRDKKPYVYGLLGEAYHATWRLSYEVNLLRKLARDRPPRLDPSFKSILKEDDGHDY